ncbi:hypothetical protein [Streptomyces sp. NPDC093591]|uniref:hypothetical protein n=1 Tax=Streptomyces sp. NPDC093591 TaxID=3366044 RepID=UPI00382DCD58
MPPVQALSPCSNGAVVNALDHAGAAETKPKSWPWDDVVLPALGDMDDLCRGGLDLLGRAPSDLGAQSVPRMDFSMLERSTSS